MTILDDLSHLDLSAITSGRASISASFGGVDLQAILSQGIGPGALGDFGAALTEIQQVAEHGPAALLEPIVHAVEGLLGGLSSDHLPIDAFRQAVEEGAQLLKGLFDGLDGDPGAIGGAFGGTLSGALEKAAGGLSSYTSVGLDEVAAFGRLLQELDRGVPVHPDAFAGVAIRALLPFSVDTLSGMRAHVDALVSGAAAITLPDTRTAGLVAALDAVVTAAAGSDTAALRRALDDVAHARANTLAVITDDLRAVSRAVDGLHLDAVFNALGDAADLLARGEEGILEFLAELRAEVARAHHLLDELDIQQVQNLVQGAIAYAEHRAEQLIGPSVDAVVERVKQWLRGLLDHLGLAAIRGEITAFLHGIASAITGAGLDGPVREATEALHRLRDLVGGQALAQQVQTALAHLADLVSHALDGVIDALSQIGNAIHGLADEAKPILEAAASALAEFKTAVDAAISGINGLGLDRVTTQVTDAVKHLRETAQSVLTVAPLPDPMRPLVEQLIHTVEAIDLQAAIEAPVASVLDQLKIPDSFKGSLDSVVEAVQHLVPTAAIEAINDEIGGFLDQLTHLNPGALLTGVTSLLQDVAGALDGLDPRPAADTLAAPFHAVLAAIDAADPKVLLQPVISAWDSLLGAIPIPSPADAASRVSGTIASAGESAGQAVVGPLQHLMPSGSTDVAPATPVPNSGTSGAGTSGGTGATTAASGGSASAGTGGGSGSTELPEVHPGDIVRLFGYIPKLLHDALAGLDAGPAGDALRAVDRLCHGLATDLRAMGGAVWAIEDRLIAGLDTALAGLAAPQLRAQSAVMAHAQLHAHTGAGGASIDVDASVGALALAGPAAFHEALGGALAGTLADVRAAGGAAGHHIAGPLERAAAALDRCHLSEITGDLEGFLAALDPEPLAADIDSLCAAALAKAPELFTAIGDDLKLAIQKLEQLVTGFNPGALFQRFLPVLDVLREQLDLLDPRRLAQELGEIHGAIRAVVAAYDPTAIAADIAQTISSVAAGIRGLDPATLLGDTSFLQPVVDRIKNALPTTALADVAHDLDAVGETLASIDLAGLVDAVNGLGPQVETLVNGSVEAIKKEILELLQALRFATGGASVSVSVSASASAGGG